MIRKLNDQDKFICNVISVTGKLLKQVEFDSFKKACDYRREMIKKNTIEDVEIYTFGDKTPIDACDAKEPNINTCKFLYFDGNGEFNHEVEKDIKEAEEEFEANQKWSSRKEFPNDLYVGYKKYADIEGKDFLVEMGIYRGGFPVDDAEAYIDDLGRNTKDYYNVVFYNREVKDTEDTDDVKIEDKEEEAEAKTEERICCICGKPIEGWGNNPNPIKKSGECCDQCNQDYVLQARIVNAYKPYQKLVFIECPKCNMPVVLATDENVCKCGKKFDMQGNEIVKVKDNSDKNAYKKTNKMEDSRAYIGEFIDEFYERYRGVNVYKKKINNIECEFVAQFLDKDLKDKTAEGIEEKIDKAIEAYVNNYAKDFDKKELK